MKRNYRIRVWQKSVDDRTQDVGQCQNSKEEEVAGQQQVDVFFGEELRIGSIGLDRRNSIWNTTCLEEDIETEKGAAGDDGKHSGVPVRHGLRLLSRLLQDMSPLVNRTLRTV